MQNGTLRTLVSWHTVSSDAVVAHLESTPDGLSSAVATQRLSQHGENRLPSTPSKPLWVVFASQFASPLIVVLLGSAVLMALFGEELDSIIIGIVLLFNALIGTFQEGKAQQTLESLRQLSGTTATVLRQSEPQTIDSTLLVPGDVIVLREGEKVAADCRLLSINRFSVDESSLTGESYPIHKTIDKLDVEKLPIADRKNMIFSGTYVSSGMATAIVVATGTNTHIGSLAQELSQLDTQVPLKRKLDELSKGIVIAVGVFSVVFFAISLFKNRPWMETFFTVISMAVSLIPEGLPVILTLVLAQSVSRMSKHQALVKKLAAVEALGQASIIAVDKTGTITLNQLAVTTIQTLDATYTVTGEGYQPTGSMSPQPASATEKKSLALLSGILKAAASAQIVQDSSTKRWNVIGDPTEGALLVVAHKLPTPPPLQSISHIPFDYSTKYSTHVFDQDGCYITALIGAPERVLSHCALTQTEQRRLEESIEQLTSQGLRCVAIATKSSRLQASHKTLDHLSLLAIVAMQDTIHPEAKEAIGLAKAAGIRVVMITGDHPNTAIAIATSVGIYSPEDGVITGDQLSSIPEEKLPTYLRSTTVFARVAPEDKLRLITAYRALGETIAMTGDGVNDAASLVAADLGIAMGRIGTEVAKEAADIVLLDDNFKSITAAIKEGRGLYLTIKHVISYLLSTGVGEALTLAVALLLGLAAPLLPVQIIWLNLVTDGFLDVALSMEPREHGLLKRNWGKSETALIDRDAWIRIGILGFTMMVGTIGVYIASDGGDHIKALTMSLTTLAAFQWFNAWNCRSNRSLLTLPLFGNKPLILATATVVLLHIGAVSLPFMQRFLHTTPLSLSEWALCIATGATIIVVEEIRKRVYPSKI